MSGPSPAVRLRGVTRSFGPIHRVVWAVDDVTLQIPAGELTLLVGPSGSGKTTLLSLAGGLLSPDRGEVEVGGRPLASLSAVELSAFRLRHVGFVFQRFQMLEALTALENIELPLNLAGTRRPESRRRAHALAARAGLHGQHEAPSGALSGGEQQRVAIARALANDPHVLLADEPTGSLDSHAGEGIIELLHETASRGTAVLVASHDERWIPYADRIVRMEDGRVQPGHP
ncbi:MAG: ABC transporter ATP-binding protein [Gemmatimonadales bacterium]|nr:MAG: ABC transporter ATP-binding protein [Gemmatimonadales bacterium]